MTHVTFSNLDVLDLCGVPGVAFSTTLKQQRFKKYIPSKGHFSLYSLGCMDSPQVSTLTSCSSILLMGMSEFSTTTSPVRGWLITQLVASKCPLIRNFGREPLCKQGGSVSLQLWVNKQSRSGATLSTYLFDVLQCVWSDSEVDRSRGNFCFLRLKINMKQNVWNYLMYHQVMCYNVEHKSKVKYI